MTPIIISFHWNDKVADVDTRLVRLTLRGDASAYGELVRRYEDRLYNTIFRMIDQEEDARDVVQEAFIRAFESLGRFNGDAGFYTWLYRIAFNAALSRKRRRKPVSLDQFSRSERWRVEPVDESFDHQPGAALERLDDERRIQRGLMNLPAGLRAVIILCDIEGQRYDEIAQTLGIPIGTVRSRLHRARVELRAALSDDKPLMRRPWAREGSR